MAINFFNEITANNSSHYIAAALSDRVSTANTNLTTQDMVFTLDKDILYGAKVDQGNVKLTIPNNIWVSGQSYEMYDSSNIITNFYVVVDENDGTKSVFKCLKNSKTFNGGNITILPSTIKPSKFFTNMSDMLYKTSDGYIWKYMYNLTTNEVAKFCSSNFVAVKIDNAIANTAVNGAIDIINITSPGSGYNKYAYASISQATIGGNLLKYKIIPTEFSNIYEFQII